MIITKPMLAGTIIDLKTIKYPVMATPKLDGIRCLKVNGKALTRSFKPIPNDFIRNFIENEYPDGVDGEIMVPKNSTDSFDTGPIMRVSGCPDFRYHCFDWIRSSALIWDYIHRVVDMRTLKLPRMTLVLPVDIYSEEELLNYEALCLANQYEGIMIRKPDSPYKMGRSTVKEGYLLKLKRFEDNEAEIIGLEEQMENTNVKEKDAFGRGKRSTAMEGLIPKDTLGAVHVRDIKTGVEFKIGTGMNDLLRAHIWNQRPSHIGKIIKYKSQPVGAKDKPRFPVFLEFRDPKDL